MFLMEQTQAVASEVRTALLNKCPLFIKGYTSSSGDVADYRVRFLPIRTGYLELVQQSLDMVKEGRVEKPDGFSVEVWHQALNEQVNSWTNSLEGNTKKRTFTVELQPHTDGYWFDPQLGSDHMVLRSLQQLDKTVVKVVEKRQVNSADKTRAKEHLARVTPIGSFIGQLNLYPGKFETVRAEVPNLAVP